MTTPICTLSVQICDDGNWSFSYVAAEGASPTLAQWMLPLSNLTMLAIKNATVSIPTATEHAQQAAAAEIAKTLPEGWAPTMDGICVSIASGKDSEQNGKGQNGKAGKPRWTRTYAHASSGIVMDAPCAEDGSTLPETNQVLVAVSAPPAAEPAAS